MFGNNESVLIIFVYNYRKMYLHPSTTVLVYLLYHSNRIQCYIEIISVSKTKGLTIHSHITHHNNDHEKLELSLRTHNRNESF